MKRGLIFVLLLAFPSIPLQAAKIPLSGRVVDADDHAVANARVALIPFAASFEQGRLELAGKADSEPVETVSADAGGSFRLTAPDAGMWKVRVTASGFVPLEAWLLPLVEATELPDARLTRDAGFQARVTDSRGRPVAGARVRLESGSPLALALTMAIWRTPVRLATTDSNGAATLPRAGEESLIVRAAAPGFPLAERKSVRGGSITLRLANGTVRRIRVVDAQKRGVPGVLIRLAKADWATGFTSKADWAAGFTSETGFLDLPQPAGKGVELHLAAEDGRGLTFHLKVAKAGDAEPATIVLPAAVFVTGKVVSAQDGRPLGGALAWPGDDPGAHVRAGADGTFRLAASSGEEAAPVEAAAAGFFPDRAQVAEGRPTHVALHPKLSADGIVVDEKGRPVAGAAIDASWQPAARLSNRPHVVFSGGFTRSAESGRFRLAALAAGFAYDLRVEKSGFAPARLEIPAREPGLPAQELRIVLRAGRLAFGKVVDGAHQPVTAARVTLRAAASTDLASRWREARHPEIYEAATDASGRFELKSLPAGSFDLTVRGRGFAPLKVPGLSVPTGAGSTDLGTVMLAPGATVRGFVVDPKGSPISGAEVWSLPAGGDLVMLSAFLREPGPPAASTADDGSFLLADLAPGEPLDLSVLHPGYGPGSAPRVVPPTEAPVRIVLQPTSRVSGRAAGPDGKPVAGARIMLQSVAARGVPVSTRGNFDGEVTDAEGAFSFEDVAPGPIDLTAFATGRQMARLKGLEVRPGQDLEEVEIVLLPGAVVEGRVLSPEGQPVQSAAVAVVDPNPQGLASLTFISLRTETDGGGHFRIEGVPPGPKTLEAQAEGYRRALRDVDVATGTVAVDFRLESGLEVSGRVVDETGDPIAGAAVTLRGERSFDSLPPSSQTGPDGTFRIAGVEDGTYRLTALKNGYTWDRRRTESVTVAGASVGGIELKLSAGGTIIGRLTGIEFSQLSRVRIWANQAFNLGQVDADANYRIPNLAPGDWEVTATVPDTPLQATGRVTLEPGEAEVRLDLQLSRGHQLRGVVLRNGQPVAGASVHLNATAAHAPQTATSDYQGGFQFGGLRDGTYKLEVGTPNGAHHEETVEIVGDREIRIELRTVSLSGRVVDALDLSPLAGVQITLAPADGRLRRFSETDARGTFRIPEVADGDWKIRASREGYAAAEKEVTVGSDPVEIELSLTPTEGLIVEAVLASGQPPGRIRVAAIDGGGNTVATGSFPLGEHGRARVSNVPPGNWLLLIDSDLSAPITVPALVPGPAIRAVLPPGGQLTVTVPTLAHDGATAKAVLLGPDGTPFRGIEWDGRVISEWDLHRGGLNFFRLPPGSWQVVVRASDGRSWSGAATVTAGSEAVVTLE